MRVRVRNAAGADDAATWARAQERGMGDLYRWWRERSAKVRGGSERGSARCKSGNCVSRVFRACGAPLTPPLTPLRAQGLPADGWLRGNKAPTEADFKCVAAAR
jgi:hypothetical protein